MSRVEVHKFGGTSVGNAQRMMTDASLMRSAHESANIVVVASAMTQVTDALIAAAEASLHAEPKAMTEIIEDLRARHLKELNILSGNGDSPNTEIRDFIDRTCDELREILRSVVLIGELTARTRSH